jgi:hypothetical protein
MQTQRCRPVSELCPVGDATHWQFLPGSCLMLFSAALKRAITEEGAPLKSPMGAPQKNFSGLFLKILTLQPALVFRSRPCFSQSPN